MSSRKRRANGRLTQQQQDEERSPGLDVEILEEQRTLEDDEDPRPSTHACSSLLLFVCLASLSCSS